MRVRREHVVACLVVGMCNHRAAASDEDAAIQLAATRLRCDDLTMMREANRFSFAGCGHEVSYACSGAACVELRALRALPTASVCAAAVYTNVRRGGYGCTGAIGMPLTPLVVDACQPRAHPSRVTFRGTPSP